MSRRRGFTLLEALLAMLMTFMVLSAVAYVLQQTLAASGSLSEQGTLAEVSYGLGRLRRDVCGALSLTQTPGTIAVQEIDPAVPSATRLASADPFGAAQQVRVEYRRDDTGSLLRQSYSPAGTLADTSTVLHCSAFRVSPAGPNNTLLAVELVVDSRRASRTYRLEVPTP